MLDNLHRLYQSSFIFRALNPRKAQLYCIGAAKSGTHSIQAIFADTLRAVHEAESRDVIEVILQVAAGKMNGSQLRDYVRQRDRRLWLEIDSSQLNFFLLDELVDLYPDARFILTIRNPYAWIDSFINHQLSRKASLWWTQLRDLRFRPDLHVHPPEEEPLRTRNLYTLDGYFSYWASHNEKVLRTVPEDRLLVVRTAEISECTEDIARFAGVPASKASREKSHAFKAKSRFDVLEELNPDYLDTKVRKHCGVLMKKYFPEIQHARDELSSLATRTVA